MPLGLLRSTPRAAYAMLLLVYTRLLLGAALMPVLEGLSCSVRPQRRQHPGSTGPRAHGRHADAGPQAGPRLQRAGLSA